MADVVVGEVVNNLNSLIGEEFGLELGIQNDMKKLRNTLSSLRDVLEDAERKQIKDEHIKDWLAKLKDAAYDGSDVLEGWLIERQLVQDKDPTFAHTGCSFQVSASMFFCLNFRKFPIEIKETINRLDEIAAESFKFQLSSSVVQIGSQFDPYTESTPTPTPTELPIIYGRDAEKEEIIHLLFENVSDLSVLPIVGMCCLGKTTLAQLVYNDKRVVEHFHIRIWICVSNTYVVETLLQKIVEYITSKSCQLAEFPSLQNRLKELLRGKRFLLVLDDVSYEVKEFWDKLKSSLACGANGSSIILTTRRRTVAHLTCTIPIYYLNALSDDQCWSLFWYHAIDPRGIDEFAIDIIKGCRGVPLALVSLGSLLCSETDKKQWKRIRDELGANHIEFFPLDALTLSYSYLPPLLRRCFSFCSLFPPDYEMEKDELIRLWIANGFVQTNGSKDLEDIGNEIFKELLRRCFFQDIIKDEYGNIKTCKMHDLMHDLACYAARPECLGIHDSSASHDHHSIRHLSLDMESSTAFDRLSISQSPLRTLIVFSRFSFVCPSTDFSHLRYLRVLNLRGMNIKILPSWICHLKHLRYLNLSFTNLTSLSDSITRLKYLHMLDLSENSKFETLPLSIGDLEQMRYLNLSDTCIRLLPKSIQRLTNLRSLILRRCYELGVLPDITKMSSLKHLDIDGCNRLSEMPVGIGQLTCLRTLPIFVVGRSDGNRQGGGISELQGLNQLKGKLEVKGLEHVKNAEEAKAAKLESKMYLTELRLSWGPSS